MVSSALPTYFLTANSADGFINGFKSVYDANDGWRVFLIKGGPGTGKSTFMKNVSQALYENGKDVSAAPKLVGVGLYGVLMMARTGKLSMPWAKDMICRLTGLETIDA